MAVQEYTLAGGTNGVALQVSRSFPDMIVGAGSPTSYITIDPAVVQDIAEIKETVLALKDVLATVLEELAVLRSQGSLGMPAERTRRRLESVS